MDREGGSLNGTLIVEFKMSQSDPEVSYLDKRKGKGVDGYQPALGGG